MAHSARISFLIAAFFLLLYLVTMPGYLQVVDSGLSLKTAEALVERQSFEIDTGGSDIGVYRKDGRTYSKFGVGLALCWVPLVLATGGIVKATHLPYEMAVHFVVSTYSVLAGAGCGVLFYWLLREFAVSQRHAILVTLGLGVGTIMWKYSVDDFSEILQSLCLLAATYGAVRHTRRSLVLTGAALAAAVLVKQVAVIYIPFFCLFLAIKHWSDKAAVVRSLLILAVTGLPFALLLLYLNDRRFGSPFETGYGQESSWFSNEHLVRNVWNVTLSPEKGLLVYSPLLIFSVALGRFFAGKFRLEFWFFVSLVAVNLLFHARYAAWEGGWCWGPRYQVPLTFLLLLPAGVALDARPRLRPLFVILLLISAAVQLVGVAVKDQEYLTIRSSMVGGRSAEMPAAIRGEWVLLKDKVLEGDNIYSMRQFGLDSDEKIDTTSYSTFRGLNLWYLQIANRLHWNALKLFPLLVLPFLVVLLVRLWRAAKAADLLCE